MALVHFHSFHERRTTKRGRERKKGAPHIRKEAQRDEGTKKANLTPLPVQCMCVGGWMEKCITHTHTVGFAHVDTIVPIRTRSKRAQRKTALTTDPA